MHVLLFTFVRQHGLRWEYHPRHQPLISVSHCFTEVQVTQIITPGHILTPLLMLNGVLGSTKSHKNQKVICRKMHQSMQQNIVLWQHLQMKSCCKTFLYQPEQGVIMALYTNLKLILRQWLLIMSFFSLFQRVIPCHGAVMTVQH